MSSGWNIWFFPKPNWGSRLAVPACMPKSIVPCRSATSRPNYLLPLPLERGRGRSCLRAEPYFQSEPFARKSITNHEHYSQRERVAQLPQLAQQAAQTVRRDVTRGFVAAELILWLKEHKIIRRGYTAIEELVSQTLSAELLVRDDTLSQLAALKQDAKDFGWRQMIREREKRATLEQTAQDRQGIVAQVWHLASEPAVRPSTRSSLNACPKRQQMRWNRYTVQRFLEVGTHVLNRTLEGAFRHWHQGFRPPVQSTLFAASA
jgi:hypothetical protein